MKYQLIGPVIWCNIVYILLYRNAGNLKYSYLTECLSREIEYDLKSYGHFGRWPK